MPWITESNVAIFPFEANFDEILKDPEYYVDTVFSCLESEFLVMPKGAGFVEHSVFERGYEALKAGTTGFTKFESTSVLSVVMQEPISIVVLRTMLGFTPPEWGYVTSQKTGVDVAQGFVPSLDRKIRMSREAPLSATGVSRERLEPLDSLHVAHIGCSGS